MKKYLALLLALAMMLSLAACGSKPAEETEAPAAEAPAAEAPAAEAPAAPAGEVSTAVTIGVVDTHYPAYPSSAMDDDFVCSGMVYDKLFEVDDNTGEYVSYILESYEWTDDVTLVMTVKDGIYFSDGKQMTAEDVLFSLQNYILQGETTDKYQYYSNIDFDASTVSEDGMTVSLVWKAPYGPALRTLNCPVMQKDFTEAHASDEMVWFTGPVGSGPYMITDMVQDSYVTFTLREDYWDTSRSFDATEITLKFYTDESAMYMDYQAGNLDVIYNVGATTVESVQTAGDQGTVQFYPDNDVVYIQLNEDDEVLSDPKVRQAIAHALDMQYITDVAYGALGTLATSHFPTTFDAYVENAGYEYNPELSVQLLEEAGYKSGDIVLNWISPNLPPEPQIGEAIQALLSQVGITVNVQTYELATALGYHLSGETDISCQHTMGGNPTEEPDNTLSAFYEGGAFASFSISSPEYNSYYYAGLNNVDEDVRWENYKKLDQWLWDNYMALPVCEVMKAVVYNDRIESFNQSALLRSCLGSLQIVGVE